MTRTVVGMISWGTVVTALGVAACSSRTAGSGAAGPPGSSAAQSGSRLAASTAGAERPLYHCEARNGTSALWHDFVDARKAAREPTLPDFSYAGYHYGTRPLPQVPAAGSRVFDVTRHGAVANDEGYDDAAIQAAIDAAGKAGGGVVHFPPGRFKLNPDGDTKKIIRIEHSHVVLKGSGAGPGGTEILFDHMKPTVFALRAQPPGAPTPTLARVVADATRESFSVEVDDPAGLRPGQWVTVRGGGTAYNPVHWGPLWPMPGEWTRMHESGLQFNEIHSVARVDGRTVHFNEPLHFTIKAQAAEFTLRAVHLLEEVGIEDIRFRGRWDSYPEEFVHHKDPIHDTGWSGVELHGVANGWVRRCEFDNFNQALQVRNSAAFTVENVRITGKKGHVSIHTRSGYGVLTRDSADAAGHHHGPAMGYWGTGTVYLRFQMKREQQFDSHSGSPYATLLDDVSGGVLSGSGGPLPGLPHHGRHLVLWNFEHKAASAKSYDFWSTAKRVNNTFARPILAGMVAQAPVSFVDEETKLEANESFGKPVTPTSLYEAQLALRLCR
jgi:hypothetical protein